MNSLDETKHYITAVKEQVEAIQGCRAKDADMGASTALLCRSFVLWVARNYLSGIGKIAREIEPVLVTMKKEKEEKGEKPLPDDLLSLLDRAF